ncbi:MAG TPA: hypothetical protein VHQ46_00215, partial [Desulfobacteria bacterium]|nr:hypothetical protein [Desulfobacteria bacterium]
LDFSSAAHKISAFFLFRRFAQGKNAEIKIAAPEKSSTLLIGQPKSSLKHFASTQGKNAEIKITAPKKSSTLLIGQPKSSLRT